MGNFCKITYHSELLKEPNPVTLATATTYNYFCHKCLAKVNNIIGNRRL